MRDGHSISPMLSGRWIIWRIAVSFSSMGNLFRNRVIQIKTWTPYHSMRLDVHSDNRYFMFIYLFFFSMIFSDMISYYTIFLFVWYIYIAFYVFSFFRHSLFLLKHLFIHIFIFFIINALGVIFEMVCLINLHWVGDLSFFYNIYFLKVIIVFCFHHVHVY